MNFKKIFFLAASVALLAVVVVAAVSFFTPGRELWADTAVFSELWPPAQKLHFPALSVSQRTRARCSMCSATAAPAWTSSSG